MNQPAPRRTTAGTAEPLVIDQRRTVRVSVNDHHAFREAISGPTQARKESEVSRLNAILDEIGKDGEG